MKKLSLCVTRYNEPWSVCKPLFDSIAMQRSVDFSEIEVVLANDGDGELDEELFGNYPFDVKLVKQPHKGVSACRNTALENSEGEYVMFCDCDDCFINAFGLHLIADTFKENPDVIVTAFIEEAHFDDGEEKLIRHENDCSFVHGKVFRRAYIDEKHLRFNEELTIHEDGYFVSLARTFTDRTRLIKNPIYLWAWNEGSVVRRDRKNFVLRTYDHLLKCRSAMIERLLEEGYIHEAIRCVTNTIWDCYYDMQKPDAILLKKGSAEDKRIIIDAEMCFKDFFTKYRSYYKEITQADLASIVNSARTVAYQNGLVAESITMTDWLKHIQNLK